MGEKRERWDKMVALRKDPHFHNDLIAEDKASLAQLDRAVVNQRHC